jgi:ABC-2 type transport system ATP-binding protein
MVGLFMSTGEHEIKGQEIISATGLRKSFGGVKAVDGIDLSIFRGEIFGFLGPNGSGKTTLLRILCGLTEPDSGSGHCLNIALKSNAILNTQRQRKIGYLAQNYMLYDELSVYENLYFRAHLFALDDVEKKIADTLAKYTLSDKRNQSVGKLSGGWRRRLELAACLLHQPVLLLLDEPTVGVDAAASAAFWSEITALAFHGSTVLVNTHDSAEAERCDRIAYLSQGRIVISGQPQALIKQANLTETGKLNLHAALQVQLAKQEAHA